VSDQDPKKPENKHVKKGKPVKPKKPKTGFPWFKSSSRGNGGYSY